MGRSGTRWRAFVLSVCLALALSACGTNVKWLIARESQDGWHNGRLIQLAEVREPAALAEVLAAEDGKIERCHTINTAARERLGRLHLPFWEQLLADFKLLVALLIPLPAVERCADAHETYDEAVVRLREELAIDGPLPPVEELRSR